MILWNHLYCSDPYKKPYLNIDSDGDGRPDINVDLDDDMEADINIDIDGDNIIYIRLTVTVRINIDFNTV